MLIGCIWIKDLVREKVIKTKMLDNPTIWDDWIIYLFHFPQQILDPNTALEDKSEIVSVTYIDISDYGDKYHREYQLYWSAVGEKLT